VLSEATFNALRTQVAAAALGAQRVKGRDTPVYAYKINRVGE
jgi:class 3 adenylate cyclase